jgi:hypothetical protein
VGTIQDLGTNEGKMTKFFQPVVVKNRSDKTRLMDYLVDKYGRGAEIRTPDLLVPKHKLAHFQRLSKAHSGLSLLRNVASYQRLQQHLRPGASNGA